MTSESIPTHCPQCQRPLRLRQRPQGLAWGCDGFPACHYYYALPPVVRRLKHSACPQCQHPLQLIQGRFGLFVGCSQFPLCPYQSTLHTSDSTQVPCPQCHEATMVARLSRQGKTFYGCSQYPNCTYTLPHKPINIACTQCHFPLVMQRQNTHKSYWQCPNKRCGQRGDLNQEPNNNATRTAEFQ